MQVNCTQCGALVELEDGLWYGRCAHCETPLYLDEGKAFDHYYLAPVYGPDALARLIRGKLVSMGLGGAADLVGSSLVFFPFWRFLTSAGRSIESFAAEALVENMTVPDISSGDLKYFTPVIADRGKVIWPQVRRTAALDEARLKFRKIDLKIERDVLIHAPYYRASYRAGGQTFFAAVNAVSGEVHMDQVPAIADKTAEVLVSIFAIAVMAWFTVSAFSLPSFKAVALFYLVGAVLSVALGQALFLFLGRLTAARSRAFKDPGP